MTAPTVTSLLQGFFTERLARQLQASPQTVSAYRDTIKLLLLFAAQKTKKPPSRLTIDDLTPSPSARSSTTSTANGTTARRPATRAWPRSTPSTAMRCRSSPTGPTPRARSWRSRNAVTTGPSCRT